MKNMDLVEEYPRDFKITQFEKILTTAKRAKDLHRGDKEPLVDSYRKPAYIALEEFNEKIIQTVYREEVETPELIPEESEEEE